MNPRNIQTPDTIAAVVPLSSPLLLAITPSTTPIGPNIIGRNSKLSAAQI